MAHSHTPMLKFLMLVLLMMPLTLAANGKAPGPILVLGDSLSAGYGIDPEEGWVTLLEKRLKAQQREIKVVNASISGETSAGGLSRLAPLLKQYQPSIVILELGGNDGLRGYPITQMRQQLTQAIDMSQAHNAKVLMLGMQIPPNYGPRYSRLFSESYSIIAESEKIKLTPFFLKNVATHPELMQKDGIHPTAEGQPQLLENIWPDLEPLLNQLMSTLQSSTKTMASGT